MIPAVLATAVSYICLSFNSAVVFRTFGIKLKLTDLLEISFVSNVTTYLINVGGMSGLPLQFILMKKRGLVTEDILAPSLFQLYFSSLMMLVLLPVGVFTLIANHVISNTSSFGLIIAASVLTILIVAAGIIVFIPSVRFNLFRGVGRLFTFVTRRSIERQLHDFDMAMNRGVTVVHRQPGTLLILLLLTIGDWAGTIACLWFYFFALGDILRMGVLVTGFSTALLPVSSQCSLEAWEFKKARWLVFTFCWGCL